MSIANKHFLGVRPWNLKTLMVLACRIHPLMIPNCRGFRHPLRCSTGFLIGLVTPPQTSLGLDQGALIIPRDLHVDV